MRVFMTQRCLRSSRGLVHRFAKNRAGATLTIFGLCLLPMMIVVSIAIDYNRAVQTQIAMNAAVDAAALQVLSRTSNPTATPPTQAQMASAFYGSLLLPKFVHITNFTPTATSGAGGASLTVKMDYTANVDTTFSNIVGVKTLPIAGSSTATATVPAYINFYMLLDNSPSMGLAANAQAVSDMKAATQNQSAQSNAKNCEFACHQSAARIAADSNTIDNYAIARQKNIPLRIDSVRQAVQTLMSTAAQNETIPNQYKVGVWTFSDSVVQLSPLSSNLPSVAAAAGNIDVVYSYDDERDNQTAFDVALPYLNNLMPNASNGTAAATPQEVLFLVTDGMQDQSNAVSTSGTKTNNAPYTNVRGTSSIGPLDVANCAAIKSKNIKIAVLYTTYIQSSDAWWQTNGATWLNPIPSNPGFSPISNALQQCASPGLYTEVVNGGSINDAMANLFSTAVQQARLVK